MRYLTVKRFTLSRTIAYRMVYPGLRWTAITPKLLRKTNE